MPSPDADSLRALIVGLGSIGRRHLECLRRLCPDAHITVWRQHHPVDGQAPPEGADAVVGSLAEALARRPQVAVIASPAPLHVSTARALVEAGVPVLVEKPLSHDRDGVAPLIEAARARGVALMVGYTLRFHPVFQALRALLAEDAVGQVVRVHAEVGQYLPDWRPGSDYRDGVSARADLGGGALLELSHEIDLVLAFLGPPNAVSARLRRLGGLEIAVEDSVELILDYAEAVATIHLDMLQRAPYRVCRVVGRQGTIEADFIAGRVRLYRDGAWVTVEVPATAERNALYLAEQQHFLDGVRTGSALSVSGADGLAVLDVVAAARRSDAEGRRVSL